MRPSKEQTHEGCRCRQQASWNSLRRPTCMRCALKVHCTSDNLQSCSDCHNPMDRCNRLFAVITTTCHLSTSDPCSANIRPIILQLELTSFQANLQDFAYSQGLVHFSVCVCLSIFPVRSNRQYHSNNFEDKLSLKILIFVIECRHCENCSS